MYYRVSYHGCDSFLPMVWSGTAVKRQYDPSGLFFVHHGVGSEAWSADGFTRLAGR